ncbi:MAG: transposase, partial [Bacillota bacterium]
IILMALIVYIVLQRRVRKALEQESKPLDIAGGKKTFAPTGNRALELFSSVRILCFKEGGIIIKRHLPKNYNRLTRALKLIGFDIDVFTRVGAP